MILLPNNYRIIFIDIALPRMQQKFSAHMCILARKRIRRPMLKWDAHTHMALAEETTKILGGYFEKFEFLPKNEEHSILRGSPKLFLFHHLCVWDGILSHMSTSLY